MKKLFAIAAVAAMAMPLFAADGAAVFASKCAMCHGADGTKTIAAMHITPIDTPAVKKLGAAGLTVIVANGEPPMPAFEGRLCYADISAVVQHVLALK